MVARVLRESAANRRLLLTCEHASADVPAEYANLGLASEELGDHIAWDVGAATVTGELSELLEAPAVLSRVSRLLVDCNRDLGDHDLMPATSHGVPIPGNAAIDAAERARRIEQFYLPYHAEIDRQLENRPEALLVSVHSFTPSLNGRERPFDVGVLFDDHESLAERLVCGLRSAGFAVRMNEPYSALDGLIFSASHHGRRNRVPYLEIEINNRLLGSDANARAVARRLVGPIVALVDGAVVPAASRFKAGKPPPDGPGMPPRN